MPEPPRYRCNHCGHTVSRDSDKRWISSYCETSGRTTRLWRVVWPPEPDLGPDPDPDKEPAHG